MSLALEEERLNQLNERQQQQQQSRDEKAHSTMGEPYFVEARSSKAAEQKVPWVPLFLPFTCYIIVTLFYWSYS